MKSRTSSIASGGEGFTNNSAITSIKEDLIKADPTSPTKTRAYQLSYWRHLIKSGQYWTVLKTKLSPAALFLLGEALLLGEYVDSSVFQTSANSSHQAR